MTTVYVVVSNDKNRDNPIEDVYATESLARERIRVLQKVAKSHEVLLGWRIHMHLLLEDEAPEAKP